MVAKFSPASPSGSPFESTQVGSGQSGASRLGLSVQVAVGGEPGVILPSETWTPGVPPAELLLTVVCAMYTLPVGGSTTWLPEIPSLPVTQSWIAGPTQLWSGLVLRTGWNIVPLFDHVSTSALLPPVVSEESTTS